MNALSKAEQHVRNSVPQVVRWLFTPSSILTVAVCAMTLLVFLQVELPLLLGMDAA